VKRGHHVRILALHPDLASCSQRRFVLDGVEVWYVGQMHAQKKDSVPVRFSPLRLLFVLITSTLGMIWGVLRSPADIYHLGKPQPVNGLAALIAAGVLRRRRFYVDCDDDEAQSNRFSANWQRVVFAFWEWLLPRLALGVTVNTHFLAQRLRAQGIIRLAYVPNGVDLALFTPLAPPVANGLRNSLGLADRRIIAYAGTLALQNHPVDLLLDAFASIAQQVPDTVLLLIGGGEDMSLVRRQAEQLGIQDRVYYTGAVPQRSVPGYLSLAIISVDPVRDNNVARARSPLKIFESMALGIPVVTGDVGDRADLLLNGAAGVLVAPDDASALAQGLVSLLAHEPRRLRLSQASRARADAYAWDTLAAQWEQVYT